MFILMGVLIGLALWAVVASAVALPRDGYRRVPPRADRLRARL